MYETRRHCRTAWRSGLAGLFLLAGLAGCRADVQFPTGRVQVNSNGVWVNVDSGAGSGGGVFVDVPFVQVEVRD